jgi:hypothetical protein
MKSIRCHYLNSKNKITLLGMFIWIFLTPFTCSSAPSQNYANPTPMEITVSNPGDLTLERLQRLKEVGVTSVQRYIHWKDIETSRPS